MSRDTEYTEQEILNKCFNDDTDRLNGGNVRDTQYSEQTIFNRIFDSTNNSLNVE